MTELDKAREEIDACDREMARLFARRMAAVDRVAAYKKEAGLPVYDAAREAEVLEKNSAYLPDDTYRAEYRAFLTSLMALSRGYQAKKNCDLYVNLPGRGYEVVLLPGGLHHAGEVCDLDRRVLVVTDSGVPGQYAKTVMAQCKEPTLACLPAGEASKNFALYEKLLRILLERGFTRGDCVVAVGGGVVGDLAGFAASTYLRGIDFYNMPTTLLSAVDASVGGKNGIDFLGVKNQVGVFRQPNLVLIDSETFATLPERQISSGMAEVIKMAATSDPALFALCERATREDLPAIIRAAVAVKRDVVEADEREGGLRRVLNFGHTVGHAIESLAGGGLLHGECVALGMLPLCAPTVRERLIALYARYGLPTEILFTPEQMLPYLIHDKKFGEGEITYVFVPEIGTYEFRRATPEEFLHILREGMTR